MSESVNRLTHIWMDAQMDERTCRRQLESHRISSPGAFDSGVLKILNSQRRCFFCGLLLLVIFCVCHAVLSVHCSKGLRS